MYKKLLIFLVIGLCLAGCKSNVVTKESSAILPSQNPPGGLKPEEVPQFVCFGFDDNSYSGYDGSCGDGGMDWAVKAFENKKNPDGTSCKTSFYCASQFIDDSMDNLDVDSLVKESWRRAYVVGHEIGLHTHAHPHGSNVEWDKDPPVWNNVLKKAGWKVEIEKNMEFLTKPYTPNAPNPNGWGPGVKKADLVGFRTPFLEFNNATFEALLEYDNVLYDCTIEEGFQDDQDGTNFFWPYQLDKGSPISDATFARDFSGRDILGSYPGLWEMPAYCVIAPDDENCEKYGLKPGFREELKKRVDYFDPADGKITGFDWNLWVEFQMTRPEVEAVLKNTLDLRLKGNKSPFLVGLHSDMYSSNYKKHNDEENKIVEHYKESQKAIENFITYALNKKVVWIVSTKSVIAWMKDPMPL